MTHPSKTKGDQWERDFAKHLQAHGFPHAERAYGAGRPDDVGDIDGTPGIVWELKNCKRFELGPWLEEAETERLNANAYIAAVIIKRRNRPARDAYVILDTDTYIRLLIEAGWGDQ